MGAFASASIEYRSAEGVLGVSVSQLRAHRLVSPGAPAADDFGESANVQRSPARERGGGGPFGSVANPVGVERRRLSGITLRPL